MSLSKGQIVNELVTIAGSNGVTVSRGAVKEILDSLSDLAVEQLESGEDFIIPGVAKLFYTYRQPQKKGERWKKGDTVTGFGGVETVKDADSPAVVEAAKLKANPIGATAKIKPGSKPEAQTAFFKTTAGKAVRSRKKK